MAVAAAVALLVPEAAPAALPDGLAALCLATRPPIEPSTLWAGWSLAPEILLPLALLLLLRLRHRAQQQAVLFLAGWLLLAAALISPLCRLAASLASAHMVQHVILVALAPPLLVLGGVGATLRRHPPSALPAGRIASRIAAFLLAPATASALYAGAIWGAHAPRVYQAALTDAGAHLLILGLLLAAALLFWTALVRAASAGAAMMMALTALIQTGLLGALLTFAPSPWYPVFAGRMAGWGLTPLEDQQLAGLIMWVPMGAIYLVAGLLVLTRLLGRLDAAAQR